MFALICNIIALTFWGWNCEMSAKNHNWMSLVLSLAMFAGMLALLVLNIAKFMGGGV